MPSVEGAAYARANTKVFVFILIVLLFKWMGQWKFSQRNDEIYRHDKSGRGARECNRMLNFQSEIANFGDLRPSVNVDAAVIDFLTSQ